MTEKNAPNPTERNAMHDLADLLIEKITEEREQFFEGMTPEQVKLALEYEKLTSHSVTDDLASMQYEHIRRQMQEAGEVSSGEVDPAKLKRYL